MPESRRHPERRLHRHRQRRATGQARHSVAASVSCLAAGATSVVGVAWAIDDDAAGHLMSRTYQEYFHGMTLSRAMRSAYLSLDSGRQTLASGLAVVGIDVGSPRASSHR
ncbi:MAG: CHAT domain-containing protein [Pseudonocardiaceae bacterium]